MKIKEGGVMDIQDKAFREWFAQYENNIEYASEKIAWDAWQAAKAQADQKVKLLLCDEHLKKCESPTGVFNSQYPDEEPCLICLAKEAKAQAVPEGFVLVAKEPSADLVNHGHQVFLGHFNEGGQTGGRSLYFAYKAMIEAQEPAND